MQTEPQKNKGNGKTRKRLGIPGRSIETPRDVNRLAKELLEKHGQDWGKAAAEAVDIIMADPGSWESFIRPLVKSQVEQMVLNLGHVNRSVVFNGFVPTLPKGVSGETLCKQDVQAQVDALDLLGMWLNKCKKPLGQATKEDLADEIAMFSDHVKWNDKKLEFLASIDARLEPGQMVGEVLDNAELAKVRASIERKVEKRHSRWDKYRK